MTKRTLRGTNLKKREFLDLELVLKQLLEELL